MAYQAHARLVEADTEADTEADMEARAVEVHGGLDVASSASPREEVVKHTHTAHPRALGLAL